MTDSEIRELAVNRQEQIAIDGPAASGKSTLAKLIAKRLGAWYVNTGDMYRALTSQVLALGVDPTIDPENAPGLLPELDVSYRVDGGNLVLSANGAPCDMAVVRSPEIATKVSYLARIPEVRAWLLARQHAAAELGLIVMEGRDIGTVVFPMARHKFFVTATPEERARRRLAQDGETVDGATLATVAKEIAARDDMDMNRPISPLKPANDAKIIDTTGHTIDEVADQLLKTLARRWQ